MPLVCTHLGISCFTMICIIPMLFLIFLCFQKLTHRTGALETVYWSPATKAKVAAVLNLDYMPEDKSAPKHPQWKCADIPLPWESRELRMLKRQLDEHKTSCQWSRVKESVSLWKGTTQIRSVTSQNQRMPRLGHAPN